jgi:uncharacterized protein YlxW (UPF0749 family)
LGGAPGREERALDYTSGTSSWRLVLARALAGLWPRNRLQRQRGWSLGVPVIALAAGLLFTTTASTAAGTALRDDSRPQLTKLISEQRKRIEARELRAGELRLGVESAEASLAQGDEPLRQLRERADSGRPAAGFTAVHGPGLTIEMNDAPRRAGNADDPDAPRNDDLVVHQGDVQSIVNGLWSGGAEAMSIMGVRVISTSAVRCVGNTLLLHGQTFSPPFTITAIGDPRALKQSLTNSADVQKFRDAVANFGLGYQETVEGDVTVPAYDASSALRYAQVAR